MGIRRTFLDTANWLLSPLGWALQRRPPEKLFPSKDVQLQVGGITISLPRRNSLAQTYRNNPHYGSYLGRLAREVKNSYPEAGAIDIGANVGDTACIIRSCADMPIICVEGDETMFPYLTQNLAQFKSADAFKLFLGEQTGSVKAAVLNEGWNNTIRLNESSGTRMIQMQTLDDFVSARASGPIKLVKIDTEGLDCAIIRSGKKFIKDQHPVISFEYNRDNMEEIQEPGISTLEDLLDEGYSGLAVYDCNGRLFDCKRLDDWDFVTNLHDYADGKRSAVYYFDLTVFHKSDNDLFDRFSAKEKALRRESHQI